MQWIYIANNGLTLIESQMQKYQVLYTICLLLAIISGVITLFLFFKLKIYNILLEVTGIRRRREIGAIQGKKSKNSHNRKKVIFKPTPDNNPIQETAILEEEPVEATVVLKSNDYTEQETTLLEPQITFVVEKELKLTESEECL